MTSPSPTAADRLTRILYLLPAASQEGGASIQELATQLNVKVDALLTDLHEVTRRAFYHPAGSGDDLQIELSPPQLGERWLCMRARGPPIFATPA